MPGLTDEHQARAHDDLKVRQAMIYALDREGLVRSVHQGVSSRPTGR